MTDNAANMVATADSLNLPHLPCSAHTLNLVVKNAIKASITNTVEEAKRVVMFFKRSAKATYKLFEMQTKLNYAQQKLKQDCPIRWNSTYEMLKRLKNNRIPLVSCVASINIKSKLEERDWTVIEQATSVLELVNAVTIEIIGEKIVTLSTMGVLIRSLLKKISEKMENESMCKEVSKLCKEIVRGIKEKFECMFDSEIINSAIILDPRFKKEGFLGDVARYESCYDNLVSKLIPLQSEANDSDEGSQQETFENDDVWEVFKFQEQTPVNNFNPRISAVSELDRYLSDKKIKIKDDPLHWWHTRGEVYPTLHKFVKQYLSIPASSVPCERIFSKAGQILTEKRSRITSQKLKEMMFIQHNYRPE